MCSFCFHLWIGLLPTDEGIYAEFNGNTLLDQVLKCHLTDTLSVGAQSMPGDALGQKAVSGKYRRGEKQEGMPAVLGFWLSTLTLLWAAPYPKDAGQQTAPPGTLPPLTSFQLHLIKRTSKFKESFSCSFPVKQLYAKAMLLPDSRAPSLVPWGPKGDNVWLLLVPGYFTIPQWFSWCFLYFYKIVSSLLFLPVPFCISCASNWAPYW